MRLTDELTRGASLSLLDAQFKDFHNAPCTAAESIQAQQAALRF